MLSRIRQDPPTQAYVEPRTKTGLSMKEILRCLKRYVVREMHRAPIIDSTAAPAT